MIYEDIYEKGLWNQRLGFCSKSGGGPGIWLGYSMCIHLYDNLCNVHY